MNKFTRYMQNYLLYGFPFYEPLCAFQHHASFDFIRLAVVSV